MKNLLLVLVCIISISSFAQQNHTEKSPAINSNSTYTDNPDSLTVQWIFPCAAFVGEYGINTNGSDIFVTQWLDDSIARYDEYGTVHETFVIPGAGKTRDLAFDGQYYYGSPAEFYFYKFDFATKTLIETVNTTFKIRGMSYDPVEGVLWATENWAASFYKLDMQGNILDSWIPSGLTLESLSGLAVDNHSVNGPFLWGFSQEGSQALIVKYDIASQTQLGNMIDVNGIMGYNSIAGGLFISQMANDNTTFTLGGMLQNEAVFAIELDYLNDLVSVESHETLPELSFYPNPVKDVLNISINTTSQEIVSGRLINQAGQLIQEFNAKVNGSHQISINTQMLNAGVYFVQIQTEKGLSLTKKIMK